jgi:hypothetical protein
MPKTTHHCLSTTTGCLRDLRVEIDHRRWISCNLGVPGHDEAEQATGLEEFLVDFVEEATGPRTDVSTDEKR